MTSLHRILIVVILLSGAMGLLYEVVWAQYLALALGSTGQAHAIVLATFMAGLAAGNAFWGRRADTFARPLALYAGLEVGIGLFAAISPLALGALTGLADTLARQLSAPVVESVLAAAVLLPPTFLMGGTLPALCRHLARQLDEMQPAVARLYFLNSLGAALGAIAAGYCLIPVLGLAGTVWLGAGVNAALGLVSWQLSRQAAPGPLPAESAPAPEAAPLPAAARWALWAAVASSGAVALAYEVGWTRLLAMVLGGSTYAFALMLGAFILGIALGGGLAGRLARRDPALGFGLAQLGVALAVLVTLPWYDRLPLFFIALASHVPRTVAGFYQLEAGKLLVCLALMLAPTVAMGVGLPLAARALARRGSDVGRVVGGVFGLNTLGSVAGALSAGLLLLPALGLQGLLLLGVACNLAAGLAVVATSQAWQPSKRWATAAGVAAVFTWGLAAGAHWDVRLLTGGVFRHPERFAGDGFEALRSRFAREQVRLHRDDAAATVTVVDLDGHRYMRVNGKPDASTSRDMATQQLIGHLPFVFKPQSAQVLVVGLGSGVTVGAVLAHPVAQADVVEISPGVTEAARLFSEANGRALDDPRLKLHLADALTFTRRAEAQAYDVVVSQPTNPWLSGVANVFSSEYYAQVRRMLKPDGVMVQWLQTYEMDDATLKLALRTFCRAFPSVRVFEMTEGDWALVGTEREPTLDWRAVEAAWNAPSVQADLARVGATRLATLLATEALAPARAAQLAGEGPVNTLTDPTLAYKAPVAFFLGTNASLFAANDDRLAAPRPALSAMALPSYLAARGVPLSADEYEQICTFEAVSAGNAVVANRYAMSWAAAAPQELRAWRVITQLRMGVEDLPGALAALERVLAIAPRDGEALTTAANLEYELATRLGGQSAAARQAMQRSLGHLARMIAMRPPNVAELQRNVAIARLALGEPKAAAIALAAAEAGTSAPSWSQALLPLWLEAARLADSAGDAALAKQCRARAGT